MLDAIQPSLLSQTGGGAIKYSYSSGDTDTSGDIDAALYAVNGMLSLIASFDRTSYNVGHPLGKIPERLVPNLPPNLDTLRIPASATDTTGQSVHNATVTVSASGISIEISGATGHFSGTLSLMNFVPCGDYEEVAA